MSDEITLTGDGIPDDWVEALQERDADAAGGDSDWSGGAAYVHDLEEPYDAGWVVVPAGLYLRTVHGNRPGGFAVTSGDPYEYVEALEAQYESQFDPDE